MSERAREPLFFEEEEEAQPQPETASAGGVRPPGRIGSGLDDDDGPHDLRSAPLENLGLSMFAYERFRAVGLTRVDFILLFNEDQLVAMLDNPGSGDWSRRLLSIEFLASQPQNPDDVNTPEPGNLARKAFKEMRKRLDELGVAPVDTDWDAARGVN